jgi:predicted enzyme related to lactoylglutathione lyase
VHIQFAELPVLDQDRAIAFYSGVLGGKVTADKAYGDGGWRWVEIEFPGAETRLFFKRRENQSPSDTPSLVLVDQDIEKTIDTLRSHNAEFVTEHSDALWNPGSEYAEFRDSEGNRIVINST